MYFIFSNFEQKVKFERELDDSLQADFNYLVLPGPLTEFKSQVTVKKFYGLRKLKAKYEYIVTLDSECEFIREEDVVKTINEIWQEKNMLNANASPDGFNIMRSCFKTLGIYSEPSLKQQTVNYKYNIWFNEIPVYKCDVLEDFFCWVEGLNQDYVNNWMCFDYYIFAAFLIIKKGYTINRYKMISLGGIIEHLYLFPVKRQIRICETFGSHWTSSASCITNKTFIRFHLDRDENDERYHSKKYRREIIKALLRRYIILALDFFHNVAYII